MNPPLDGLILGGGSSRRMGTDKALLDWNGEAATMRLRRFLAPFCERVLLSRASVQDLPPGWTESDTVRDLEIASGPLRGILSALTLRPTRAFLVVAVDQPLLDHELLATLVGSRDASVHATCFLDSDGTFPDPMCAIYEPSFAEASLPWAQHGKGCPRKVLLNAPAKVLPSPGARLRDADSPEERAALSTLLGYSMTIVLHHFAMVRERAGLPTETVTTSAVDLATLWEETRTRLSLPFERTSFRAVRNDEFAPWDTPLQDGDQVAFLPPVSGG